MASKTKYVILGLLSEQPLSGYEIKKLIDVRFRFFWSESYGQIYPELKKLASNGLVTTLEMKELPRSQQRYQITEKGQTELKAWMGVIPEKESVRLEILLKMYFASLSTPQVIEGMVNDFQLEHQKDLAMLNLFKKELTHIEDPYHNHEDVLRVIDFGIKTNQAYLAWCQETLKSLKGAQ